MSSNRFLAGELDISPELVQSTLTLSTEAIQFQHESPLFKELTAEFAKLTNKSSAQDWYKSKICDIIKKHTNISLRLELWEGVLNAAMLTPDITAQSIFSVSSYEWDVGRDGFKILKADVEKAGKVDLKNGRVDGIFAKLESTLTIGTELRRPVFKPEQAAAVVLHEIGHFFTVLEVAAEIRTTNIITHAIVSSVLKTEDQAVKMELVQSGLKQLGINVDNKDLETLAKAAEDEKTFYVAVMSEKISTASATGNSYYDTTSCEAAADQFAARHGAGAHLVEFLSLLYKESDDPASWGKAKFVAHSLCRYVMWTAVSVWCFPLAPVVLMLWVLTVFSRSDQGVYDSPKDRIARVRRETVAAIKDMNLPVGLRKRYEADLASIEAQEAEFQNHEAFTRKVYLFFSKAGRTQKARMTMHQVLEELANNKLFSSANSLFSRAE